VLVTLYFNRSNTFFFGLIYLSNIDIFYLFTSNSSISLITSYNLVIIIYLQTFAVCWRRKNFLNVFFMDEEIATFFFNIKGDIHQELVSLSMLNGTVYQHNLDIKVLICLHSQRDHSLWILWMFLIYVMIMIRVFLTIVIRMGYTGDHLPYIGHHTIKWRKKV
jgi:hypothetical protein